MTPYTAAEQLFNPPTRRRVGDRSQSGSGVVRACSNSRTTPGRLAFVYPEDRDLQSQRILSLPLDAEAELNGPVRPLPYGRRLQRGGNRTAADDTELFEAHALPANAIALNRAASLIDTANI